MALKNQLIEKNPATINTVTRVGGNILNSIIILNYLSFSTIITILLCVQFVKQFSDFFALPKNL